MYHRDKLNLIDFYDFDPIYMVISALGNVTLGKYLNQWVVFNYKDLCKCR